MPVLALAKQGLYPHLAFPQCLAVGFGVAVAAHPFDVLLIKAAPDPSSLLALRAVALEGARVAGGGLGSVPDGSLLVVVALAAQGLASGADVEVLFGVVGELVLAEQGTAFIVFGQHHVGAHAGFLYGRYVLGGAVGSNPGNRAWVQAPTEAAPEEQLEHGEILGDLRRRH